MKSLLFLSCEHAGNEVPPMFRPWFKGLEGVLASHRGWDIGALDLFGRLRELADASISNRLSRLCIEFNRSEDSKQLFSEYTRVLPGNLRQLLVDSYRSYRSEFEAQLDAALKDKYAVLHISVHSFTPVLNGKKRDCDIGLLYDPAHSHEAAFCNAWRDAIRVRAPGLRVRMNYPYKGTSDGYTRTLRKQYGTRYAGIELEVNQKFAPKGLMSSDIKEVLHASVAALRRA